MATATSSGRLAALLEQLEISCGRLAQRSPATGELEAELQRRLEERVELQRALGDEAALQTRLGAELELRTAQLEAAASELTAGTPRLADLRRLTETRRQWIEDQERFTASREAALRSLEELIARRQKPGDGAPRSPFARQLETWAKESGPELPELLRRLREHIESLARDLETAADKDLAAKASDQQRLRERLGVHDDLRLEQTLEARRAELLARAEQDARREAAHRASSVGVELRARTSAAAWRQGEQEGATLWRQLERERNQDGERSPADEDAARLDRWVLSAESNLRGYFAELRWLQGEARGEQLWHSLGLHGKGQR